MKDVKLVIKLSSEMAPLSASHIATNTKAVLVVNSVKIIAWQEAPMQEINE